MAAAFGIFVTWFVDREIERGLQRRDLTGIVLQPDRQPTGMASWPVSMYRHPMGDVINLNQARKARARADRTARADANRVAFGRSKADRDSAAAERARQAALLDAAKRED